ncbi:hypothetical protein HDZ31DRAFT_72847 [Schizophyllum fasciatum]
MPDSPSRRRKRRHSRMDAPLRAGQEGTRADAPPHIQSTSETPGPAKKRKISPGTSGGGDSRPQASSPGDQSTTPLDGGEPFDPDYKRPNWNFYRPKPEHAHFDYSTYSRGCERPRPETPLQPTYDSHDFGQETNRPPAPPRTWIPSPHPHSAGFICVPAQDGADATRDFHGQALSAATYTALQRCAFHPGYRLWARPPHFSPSGEFVPAEYARFQGAGLVLRVRDTLFAVDAERLLSGHGEGARGWERAWARRDWNDGSFVYGQPVLEVHAEVTPKEMEAYLENIVECMGLSPLYERLDDGALLADFDAALGILKIATLYADARARAIALDTLDLFFPSRSPARTVTPQVSDPATPRGKTAFAPAHALRALPVLQRAAAHAQIPAALCAAAQAPHAANAAPLAARASWWRAS